MYGRGEQRSPSLSSTAPGVAGWLTSCPAEVARTELCSRTGPPGFVPSSGGYGAGRSGGPPPGYGAPVHDRGYGGARGHAGLGTQGAAPNLPRPPNLPPTPHMSMSPDAHANPGGVSVGGGERYSLFVGSIVDGLENGWLEKILAVRRGLAPSGIVDWCDSSDPRTDYGGEAMLGGANRSPGPSRHSVARRRRSRLSSTASPSPSCGASRSSTRPRSRCRTERRKSCSSRRTKRPGAGWTSTRRSACRIRCAQPLSVAATRGAR